MSFQFSYENDRVSNPYPEAQNLLSSLRSRAPTNFEAPLIKVVNQVGELRGTETEVFLQLLEGLRAAAFLQNLF